MTGLLRNLRRLSKPAARNDLEQRHAESLGGVVDDDNFATCDHRTVHDHVDGIADPLIKRDDGAARELHEPGDRQRGRAEHDLHRDRDRQDRVKIRAFCIWLYPYPAFLRYAAHSAGGYWARILPLASEIAS